MAGQPMAESASFHVVGWATTLLIAIGQSAFGGGLAILGIPQKRPPRLLPWHGAMPLPRLYGPPICP